MAKILLVDDSPIIHRMVTKHLNAAAHEVVACGIDGNEGVALFLQHSPDLVIMDITMPNCDGRECLKRIMENSPKAKVIMLSSLAAPEIIKDCMNKGAAGFLSKERIGEDDYLVKMVNSVLGLVKEA